ncbi:ACT domain-containing protein [Mycobacterium sp. 48b]|uniref:ACT domain-containing protein n=1 Tax=Mycobacterium sp. 48b TaxID=3400426 RepID=UPI003AB0A28C
MQKHVISLLARDVHSSPSRVCTLLAQRQIAISSLQFSEAAEHGAWWIQLAVEVDDSAMLGLLINRLNRLIDVTEVVALPSGTAHYRQSVFVTLTPVAPAERDGILGIAAMFGAELLSSPPDEVQLHLCADPVRCSRFVTALERHTPTEVRYGALSAIRASATRPAEGRDCGDGSARSGAA